MKSKVWALALASLVLPILAGCETPKAAPPPPPPPPPCGIESSAPAAAGLNLPNGFAPIPLNQARFQDPEMRKYVLIQSLGVVRNGTGTVQVWARIYNCTTERVQLEGRVQFLAADQSPTEPMSGWRRIFIEPRSLGVYQENSIDAARVATYYVELRDGQ